jgi:hypothetical protein
MSKKKLKKAIKGLADYLPSFSSSANDEFGETTSFKSYKSCYENHPPLTIKEGITIYGGSANYPVRTDLDIYVSLDKHGSFSPSNSFPWESGYVQPVCFTFTIPDMSTPESPIKFKVMVEWLSDQLNQGKGVHVGCIGGHGRTGMVLSALVKMMTGEKDAIQFVRKHYCKKVVETDGQVKFLQKHFGVSSVSSSKEFSFSKSSYYPSYSSKEEYPSFSESQTEKFNRRHGFSTPNTVADVIQPVRKSGNIWGIDN